MVPLRLTGGASAVYQQLTGPDKENNEKIKKALISVFTTDKFLAYEQFTARRLRDGESVDVYVDVIMCHLRQLFQQFPMKQ